MNTSKNMSLLQKKETRGLTIQHLIDLQCKYCVQIQINKYYQYMYIYIYVYTLPEVDRICDVQTYSHFTEVFGQKKVLVLSTSG